MTEQERRDKRRARYATRDQFATQRLPDLPHAGYSSRKQKETSDAIMHFMRAVERKRELLLMIVAAGPERWRSIAGRIWRGLLIDNELLDATYRYFQLQAGDDPLGQLKRLERMRELGYQIPFGATLD